MKNLKPEFDEFVKNYREKQDSHLWISGEDSEFFAKYKVHKLATWLPELLLSKNEVLDFGCGDGLMTEFLRYYFNNSNLTGVDVSLQSIKIAKSAYPKIKFIHLEQDVLPFEPESFDLITAAGVFHHIPHDQHKLWLDQIFTVLKKNGFFVLFELNPLNIGTQWIFQRHPMEKDAKMIWPWKSYKMLAQYGQTDTKYYSFFPGFLAGLRFLEPYLEKIPFGALYATIVQKK